MTAQTNDISEKIESLASSIEKKIIEIRRDIHANPELSNREFRTSKIVADYLTELGLEVKTGVAKTGVVGILKGKPGNRVVAFRADMDALPITEETDVPFASKVKTELNGREVGVMHACGHDVHTSIQLGVAEILSKLKDEIPGTIMFIFQPAEESALPEKIWGAELMIEEGIFDELKPDAIFCLHTWPLHVGDISFSDGTMMASGDFFTLKIKGKGTHGAVPWGGVDPITVSAQVILGLQNITSRQVDLPKGGAVISVGSIHGGSRQNVIPSEVELKGTIRTLDNETRLEIYDKMKTTAEHIALSAGATAELTIDTLYPVSVNDKNLADFSQEVLKDVRGVINVTKIKPVMIAEDFSFFQQVVPGFFFFLGIAPPDADLENYPINHSPKFYVDEDAIVIGMKALSNLAVHYC
ncbi:MAG: amidohydrolase [Ignavibacteria bacterium]